MRQRGAHLDAPEYAAPWNADARAARSARRDQRHPARVLIHPYLRRRKRHVPSADRPQREIAVADLLP